ncbi:MAG TPA: copper resistance protein CopC [Thermomicrobiales bacterium]|nr:copper resistance protein CopC [Thermomicrobiales bacterium]
MFAPRRLLFLALAAGLALALLFPALAPTPAAAHAFLVSTTPASGSVAAANIGEVRLTFTEPVTVRPQNVAVATAAGKRVDRGDAHTLAGDVATVSVSVPHLDDGVYTVTYALISDDTHPVSGTFSFGVDVAPTGAAGATTGTLTSTTLLEALGRWLTLVGLVLLVGPVAFRLFVLTPAASVDVTPIFERRAVRWLWIAVAVLVVGLLANLIATAAASTLGPISAALTPGALIAALTGRFGNLWLARLALLLVPALALPLIGAEHAMDEVAPDEHQGRRTLGVWWAMLLAGGALAALIALGGHAATTAPVALSVLVDWTHVAATGVWIGGLLTLAFVLPGVTRSLGAADGGLALASAAPRFSLLATGCIQALIVTGLYQIWAHVARPENLATTAYGRTLLLKLALVVPLVALGAVNRLTIVPRLRERLTHGASEAGMAGLLTRRLWRVVWGEAALGLAVLAVVGLLTALPPARDAEAATGPTAPGSAAGQPNPNSNAVTLAANAGTTLVTLTVGDTSAGAGALTVVLHDPLGNPLTDAAVQARLTPPAGGVATTVALTQRNGQYNGATSITAAGHWQIAVDVTPKDAGASTATFALDLPAGGARWLLAASDAAMNRLTSLREHQTISSGGTPVVTEYEFVAPDKAHIQTGTASETIAVGTQRFDRTNGGAWSTSTWPEDGGYRWPRNDYASGASEVTLLGQEQVDGVACWVVAFLDNASGARLTFWIGQQDYLVQRETMYATGHYMESRYSDFNAPITIVTPR